jgi:sugar/nucleoside kinase (ribokinase family)
VPDGTRTLGVVGTLVWDTIHRRGTRELPVEEWGGIGYALESLAASLPDGWRVRPVLKVGRDLSEAAFRYLREIPGVDVEPGVMVVPEPNNRVELTYLDEDEGSPGDRRRERLSGGVPPWRWAELAPRITGCDALYVNFISGFEMDLDAARALRSGFPGPIWADLHSLFLGIGRAGDRIPRPLPDWAEWISSFDAVQMNDDEFSLLGRLHGDSWALASSAVGRDLRLVVVTLGGEGAGYVAAPAFDPDPFTWPRRRGGFPDPGPSRSGRIPLEGPPVRGGDPIGCGDVWGSTVFARLLAGDTIELAMREGNRMAARNVSHHGARGLRHHLGGRVAPVRNGEPA